MVSSSQVHHLIFADIYLPSLFHRMLHPFELVLFYPQLGLNLARIKRVLLMFSFNLLLVIYSVRRMKYLLDPKSIKKLNSTLKSRSVKTQFFTWNRIGKQPIVENNISINNSCLN